MSISEKKLQSMKSATGGNRGTPVLAVQDPDVFCKYSHRVCSQNCLEGYDFCTRHILEDKAAPYKQCAYMTKAGRKCPAAAPKLEKKEGFCSAHNRKSLLARQRLARKRRPGETGETLLEELVALTSARSGSSHHEHRRSKMFPDSVASRALEYASSSDSETELGPAVEQTWRDDGDSDAESIDSDQEDLLKYAGVYTTEEVAQILRDKLIRLQALYIDQFKRLKHMLLVKRRQYLKAKGPEREAFGSVKLYKKDLSQRERYQKLKAMQQYHRKAGKEALLQRQSTERRIQASANSGPLSPSRVVTGIPTKPAFPTCSFLDDGVVCGSRAVPLSKFCQKHILHDPCQLLYRPCPFADSQCGRPVPTLLNTQFCSLHQPLPKKVKLEVDKDGVTDTEWSLNSSQDTVSSAAGQRSSLSGMDQKIEVKQEVKPDPENLPGKRSIGSSSRSSGGGRGGSGSSGGVGRSGGSSGSGGGGRLSDAVPRHQLPRPSSISVDSASSITTNTGAFTTSSGSSCSRTGPSHGVGPQVVGEVKMEVEGDNEGVIWPSSTPTATTTTTEDSQKEKDLEDGEGGGGDTVIFTLGEAEEEEGEDKQGR